MASCSTRRNASSLLSLLLESLSLGGSSFDFLELRHSGGFVHLCSSRSSLADGVSFAVCHGRKPGTRTTGGFCCEVLPTAHALIQRWAATSESTIGSNLPLSFVELDMGISEVIGYEPIAYSACQFALQA